MSTQLIKSCCYMNVPLSSRRDVDVNALCDHVAGDVSRYHRSSGIGRKWAEQAMILANSDKWVASYILGTVTTYRATPGRSGSLRQIDV